MKFLSCLALLTLISCSSSGFKKNIDATSFRTSGVEQFFLPELPPWANASADGGCFKTSSFMYLNFPKLKEAYQLTYLEMVELQAQYNERLENYFRSTAVRFLKPMEEASFFSNTLEQVRGGLRSMRLPQVKEVEVFWLESYTPAELKKVVASEQFSEKLPILFSSCHSKQSLTQWIAQEQLEEAGFFTLSAEWLTPYNTLGELRAGMKVELAEILGKEVKINMNSFQNKNTTELILP